MLAYTLNILSVGITQSAIKPSAERYFTFFCGSAFALYERKNRTTDTMRSAIEEFES